MQSTLSDVKKHHTSKNSIQSFLEFKQSGKQSKEHVMVHNALQKYQPCTSRQLSLLTGLERGNICRILHDAIGTGDPIIKILYNKKCPVTKKTVGWYSLIDFAA